MQEELWRSRDKSQQRSLQTFTPRDAGDETGSSRPANLVSLSVAARSAFAVRVGFLRLMFPFNS